MAVSFEHDIRPLFRDSPDVDSMREYGLDLSSYEEVRAKAEEIYARLEDGSMPCAEPWSAERLALFRRWMEEAWPLSVAHKESSRHPVGDQRLEVNMRIKDFSFGSIQIDGVTYEHDVVIDRGKIGKRKKKASKKFRDEFGHTPLSIEEAIPWKCRQLVIGTGAYGGLPVMKDVKLEAARRKIELLILPTAKAIEALEKDPDQTNAILHVTC